MPNGLNAMALVASEVARSQMDCLIGLILICLALRLIRYLV